MLEILKWVLPVTSLGLAVVAYILAMKVRFTYERKLEKAEEEHSKLLFEALTGERMGDSDDE